MMGETCCSSCIFTLIHLLFIFQFSRAMEGIILESLAQARTTTVHVRDSLVFKHNNHQNLYLFHDRRAFDLCIFDQATLIYDGKSTYFTWHPSRPGYYYFSTRDGLRRSCENGEKVQVRVITPDPAPEFPSLPAPAPTSGGEIAASPSNTWMFSSPGSTPSPAPEVDYGPLLPRNEQAPAAAPSRSTDRDGTIPFISSNPAVPLPTGETDTATVLPLPASGSESQVAGLGSSIGVGKCVPKVVIILSFVLFG